MTNIQSRLTIDWVIRNLHFELSVDFTSLKPYLGHQFVIDDDL